MSDAVQRRWTLVIAAIGAVVTIVTLNFRVGSAMGRIEEKLAAIEKSDSGKSAIDQRQDQAINSLERGQAVMESRLHGISSTLGKMPARVADRIAADSDE